MRLVRPVSLIDIGSAPPASPPSPTGRAAARGPGAAVSRPARPTLSTPVAVVIRGLTISVLPKGTALALPVPRLCTTGGAALCPICLRRGPSRGPPRRPRGAAGSCARPCAGPADLPPRPLVRLPFVSRASNDGIARDVDVSVDIDVVATMAIPADAVADRRSDEHTRPKCRRGVIIVGIG